MSSTTIVLVQVIDVNDNIPVFINHTVSIEVVESPIPDRKIYLLSAFDADAGANAYLSYKIVSGGEGKFTIDDDTGKMRVSLDS